MALGAHAGTTEQIIGAAIEVHRELGPGLLESAYQACLRWELEQRRIAVRKEVPLPLRYKGLALDIGYRLDLLVADQVIVEVKSVESLVAIHTAQLLTYLRLAHMKVGLIINFNVPLLKDGVKRVIL
ncbi:MAG: GxxExxY protein [Planctomycetota bacterium]